MAKAKNIKETKIPRFLTAKDFPKYYKGKDYYYVGVVKKETSFEVEAGRKVELSKVWFKKLIYVNQFILMLSIFTTIMIFVFLSGNESPTVFANFNTGKLMCSNEPINLKTEKPIGRESEEYKQMCDELSNFNNEG